MSQVALSYSNVPAGNIYNSATGGYSPVLNSYYTPLLGIYLQGQFPGYTSQPNWLNYVLNGQFAPEYNIIAINGTVLNLSPTSNNNNAAGSNVPTSSSSSPITGSISSLPALQNLAAPSSFPTGIQTVLQLVGSNFGFPNYSCNKCSNTPLSIVNVGTVPMLGNLQSTSVLTANFTSTPVTQSVALRFTLNLIGEVNNVPLTITANQVPVLTVPITGNNTYQNIEVQFPYSPSNNNSQLVVAMSFAPTGANNAGAPTSSSNTGVPTSSSGNTTPFKWAIGQLAASFNTVPAGYIPNSQTGGYSPVENSFFTPMLQLYLAGSFPGETTQPNWLNYVLNGQFSPENNIIAINGTVLNLGSSYVPTLQSALANSNFLTNSKTILELVGSSPNTNNFGVTNAPSQITTVGSIPALGQLSPNSVVSYSMTPLATTQAGIVRFTLLVTGPANAQLSINTCYTNVLTAPITGTNIYQNVEAQFPLSLAACVSAQNGNGSNNNNNVPLQISLVPLTSSSSPQSVGSTPSYQWAISQLAISYSGVPAGYISNNLNEEYSPVLNSYLTPALSNFYAGSFPGYNSSQQPIWLPYVLSGQFNNANNIIAINGTILNLEALAANTPAAVALGLTPSSLSSPSTIGVSAIPLNNSLSSISQLQANSGLPQFYSQTQTVLELVGATPNLANFSTPSGNLGLSYVGTINTLGQFSPSQSVTYTLSTIPTTQSVTARFNLYMIGTATNAPLNVTANGVNVLSIPLTGTNFNQQVEVQFTLPYNSTQSQVPLTISFAPTGANNGASPSLSSTEAPFKWAVSQLAVSYSNVPAGYVYNSLTGGQSPIVNSYVSAILQNYYNSSFPGYSAQPTWLPYVTNGQFSNAKDTIAINGVILNLGSPSVNNANLQNTLQTGKFLANTQTILELVGSNFSTSNFVVTGAPATTVPVSSILTLGQIPSTGTVTYNMVPLTSTQAGIVRFTLLVNGSVSNVPLTVTAGGSPVLTIPLTGENFFQNVEVQFPLNSSSSPNSQSQGIPLTISFGVAPTSGSTIPTSVSTTQTSGSTTPTSGSTIPTTSPFQWGISQLALTYSNAPAGYIPNSCTCGNSPVANSYYTPALGVYYGGSFPGYSSSQQPVWLPYVMNGQFSNGVDIIAINGTVLNFGGMTPLTAMGNNTAPSMMSVTPLSNSLSSLPNMQATNYLPEILSQSPTVLELVGANFNLANFSCSTCTLSNIPLNGIPVVGGLSTPSVLTYTMSPLASTNAATVRFQLTIAGTVSNVPLTMTANNYSVLTIPLTGSNIVKNIEVQFPLTSVSAGQQVPLQISFNASPLQASVSPFQWGVSQFAVSYSAVPAGSIANSVTGGYSPVLNSYLTPLLQNYYNGSFPGYNVGQQPTWLSYVLNGQYAPTEIIAINGTVLNFGSVSPTSGLGQVLQANNFAPLFATQTKTVIELTGNSPSLTNFGVNQGNLGTTPISSVTALGQLSPSTVLSYTMSPLSTTNSGIVRFVLFVNGSVKNQPICVSLNGANVLTAPLTGKNMFQNVEIQFPLSSSSNENNYKLNIGFTCSETSSESLSSAPFTWAISQLATTYSSAPAGYILNGQNGGISPVANSYYTPALGVFYGGSFPQYTSAQQPLWIPYVLNGQFQNALDIIAINGTILNFGPTPLNANNMESMPMESMSTESMPMESMSTQSMPMESNSISSLPSILSNNYASKFPAQALTYLELVGPSFNTNNFTSPTTNFGVLHINSIPVIGYFSPSNTVQTTLSPLASTKAINVRFTLFVLGQPENAPLTITANGKPVLSYPLSTNNYYQNVEVQFPYTYSPSNSKVPLAITLGSAPSSSSAPESNVPFQWALGQVAISFSNVPAGNIYNSVNGGSSPVLSSYFTPLLQIYLGSKFPGYTNAQQPIWLNYVLNGQCTNSLDIIAINGTIINCVNNSPANLQASQLAGSFYPQTLTVLELVGPKFGYSNFKCSTCSSKLGTTTIGSIPALGQFSPSNMLSYTLTPLGSTKSAIVRFTLFISGNASNAPLTLSANNINFLTIPITGKNIFQNIEAQFPYTYSPSNSANTLTIQFGSPVTESGSSAAPFKWAISQMAITYSSAPSGYIPNTNGLGYSPVANSYYTPALGIYYGGAFPKYTSAQQPLWIPYVLNGQCTNSLDIIAINGTIINCGNSNNAGTAPLSNSLSNIETILSANNNGAPFLANTRTVLELVGLNFKYPSFTTSNGSPSIMYIESVPALGNFAPNTILSYALAPSTTTNAIIVRFNLHMMGSPSSSSPFTITLNGANVLSTPVTSTLPIQYIEAQFPYYGNYNNNQSTLTISFIPAVGSSSLSSSTAPFKWAISQFAVTYTNAPSGNIPNSVTGSYMPVANSFQSAILQIYYAGKYPGYSAEQQPNWLGYILNGQFSNNRDIIAINGTILNFGSPLGGEQYYNNGNNANYEISATNNGNNGLSNNGLITLVIDLVGSSNKMYNIEKWSVNKGNLTTIQLNGFPSLGYISPGYTLTREYLNIATHKSIAIKFHLSVASPTGLTFWVRANGIPVMQSNLQSGTYYRIIEAQFPNTEKNVVITLGSSPAYGASPSNAGGFAINSFGFYASPCGVKNFFNTQLNACQLAGNSAFYALSYVNYPKGFQWLSTQPSWLIELKSNNVATPYELYYIKTQSVKYLTGTETYALVSPSSINRPQYTALGGNQVLIELVNLKSSPSEWTYTTSSSSGSAPLTTMQGYNSLGSFNIGTNYILSRTFTTLTQHATVTVRFRLIGTGNWSNYAFTTLMNGIQIFTKNITMTNDFRDIELQFVHTQPTLELKFYITSQGAPIEKNAGWALNSFVLHLNPCSVTNTFSLLLNTCAKVGNTAVYSLYRTDYYGQFYNTGLNLTYLPKFQSENGLIDDGREIYGIWTGEAQKPVQSKFTGLTIIELSGTNFNMSDFQIRGTRQPAYSSQLYGGTLLGPFESTTIIRRVFTELPVHNTVTVRFRLYLVGPWIDQNTIVQSGGTTVFKYVLGETDTYQDLEVTFDHSSPTLDLEILSTPSTERGARSDIKFGISDMAVHLNPCGQQSYFNIGMDKCAKSSGYSTMYSLVQSNLAGNFPVKSATPTWVSILSNPSGINNQAHEVYSFLKGNRLEVIKGVHGKPQFVDLDLLTRLKKQINSKRVKTDADTQALAFLSGRTSTEIVGDYNNGTISSYGSDYNNLFGTSFLQSKVDQFEFSFGVVEGWACVGLIEAADAQTLDLNTNYRNQSLVICSDDQLNLNTEFLVKIDVANKHVIFQDKYYKQTKSLPFNSINDLYYTVQFYDKGTVYFGKQVHYYQAMKSSHLRKKKRS